MKAKVPRLFFQYLAAFLFSLFGGVVLSDYFIRGGSMGDILYGIWFAGYIGSAVGVVVGDVSLYKGHKLSLLGVFAGVILMVITFPLAGLVLFVLEDVMPEVVFFILHWVIVTTAFVVGYNGVGSLIRKMEIKKHVVEERGTGIEWAKTSFVCAVLSWTTPLVIAGMVLIVLVALNVGGATPGGWARLSLIGITKDALTRAAVILSAVLGVGALVSGIVGWGKILWKEGSLKAAGFVHNGLILGCLCLTAASGVLITDVKRNRRVRAIEARRPKIVKTFRGLGASSIYIRLMNYSNRNGDYPKAETWSDILTAEEAYKSQREYFDEELTKYAINPNVRSESPADTVLFFETEKGWNKCGGPELMAFDEQDQCLVVFNDGKTETVNKQEIHKLNWGDEGEE